jgi:CheY-like chemotaxis protein
MAVRPKIIYVEDNKADGELFRRNLERSAVSAELLILNNSDCMTRLQGIAVDDGNLPDVLIFDLKMPGQSGIGILQEVRTIPAYDATPVVMFSGSLGPPGKGRMPSEWRLSVPGKTAESQRMGQIISA